MVNNTNNTELKMDTTNWTDDWDDNEGATIEDLLAEEGEDEVEDMVEDDMDNATIEDLLAE